MLDPVAAMNLENRNGSVQVTLPEDAKFNVQAASADGEINSDFQLSVTNAGDRSVASGTVNGGGPLLNIVAEKGDITVHKAGANAAP